MSKKCCGVIYSDEDEVCKICGKSLTDESEDVNDAEDGKEVNIEPEKNIELEANTEPEEFVEQDQPKESAELPELEKPVEVSESTSVEKSEDEDEPDESGEEKAEDEKSDKASVSHIIFGIISILIAVAGTTLIGFGIYFLMISPAYANKGAAGTELVFPEIATMSDASMSDARGILGYTEIATAGDAFIESSKVSTDTDADTDTDTDTNTDDDMDINDNGTVE